MEVFPWFIAISLFGTVLDFCDTGNGPVRNFQFLIHDDIHSKSVTGLRKNIEAPNLLHYFRNQLAWYSGLVLFWDRFFPKCNWRLAQTRDLTKAMKWNCGYAPILDDRYTICNPDHLANDTMAANYWSLNGGLLRNFGGISNDSIDGDLSFLIYEGTVFRVGRKAYWRI